MTKYRTHNCAELTSKNNGSKVVADADSVVVMVNYKTGEKVPIDSDNRKKLEAFI